MLDLRASTSLSRLRQFATTPAAAPKGDWCNSSTTVLLDIAYIPADIHLFPQAQAGL